MLDTMYSLLKLQPASQRIKHTEVENPFLYYIHAKVDMSNSSSCSMFYVLIRVRRTWYASPIGPQAEAHVYILLLYAESEAALGLNFLKRLESGCQTAESGCQTVALFSWVAKSSTFPRDRRVVAKQSLRSVG
jgi:hypothetical protein